MPLDPAISDALTTQALTSAQHDAARLRGVADNLFQGLGVVNTNLIQTHGGTTDDAATFGALRTAIQVPEK